MKFYAVDSPSGDLDKCFYNSTNLFKYLLNKCLERLESIYDFIDTPYTEQFIQNAFCNNSIRVVDIPEMSFDKYKEGIYKDYVSDDNFKLFDLKNIPYEVSLNGYDSLFDLVLKEAKRSDDLELLKALSFTYMLWYGTYEYYVLPIYSNRKRFPFLVKYITMCNKVIPILSSNNGYGYQYEFRENLRKLSICLYAHSNKSCRDLSKDTIEAILDGLRIYSCNEVSCDCNNIFHGIFKVKNDTYFQVFDENSNPVKLDKTVSSINTEFLFTITGLSEYVAKHGYQNFTVKEYQFIPSKRLKVQNYDEQVIYLMDTIDMYNYVEGIWIDDKVLSNLTVDNTWSFSDGTFNKYMMKYDIYWFSVYVLGLANCVPLLEQDRVLYNRIQETTYKKEIVLPVYFFVKFLNLFIFPDGILELEEDNSLQENLNINTENKGTDIGGSSNMVFYSLVKSFSKHSTDTVDLFKIALGDLISNEKINEFCDCEDFYEVDYWLNKYFNYNKVYFIQQEGGDFVSSNVKSPQQILDKTFIELVTRDIIEYHREDKELLNALCFTYLLWWGMYYRNLVQSGYYDEVPCYTEYMRMLDNVVPEIAKAFGYNSDVFMNKLRVFSVCFSSNPKHFNIDGGLTNTCDLLDNYCGKDLDDIEPDVSNMFDDLHRKSYPIYSDLFYEVIIDDSKRVRLEEKGKNNSKYDIETNGNPENTVFLFSQNMLCQYLACNNIESATINSYDFGFTLKENVDYDVEFGLVDACYGSYKDDGNSHEVQGIWVSEKLLASKKLRFVEKYQFSSENVNFVKEFFDINNPFWFSIYLCSKITENDSQLYQHNNNLESLIHEYESDSQFFIPTYLFTRMLKLYILTDSNDNKIGVSYDSVDTSSTELDGGKAFYSLNNTFNKASTDTVSLFKSVLDNLISSGYQGSERYFDTDFIDDTLSYHFYKNKVYCNRVVDDIQYKDGDIIDIHKHLHYPSLLDLSFFDLVVQDTITSHKEDEELFKALSITYIMWYGSYLPFANMGCNYLKEYFKLCNKLIPILAESFSLDGSLYLSYLQQFGCCYNAHGCSMETRNFDSYTMNTIYSMLSFYEKDESSIYAVEMFNELYTSENFDFYEVLDCNSKRVSLKRNINFEEDNSNNSVFLFTAESLCEYLARNEVGSLVIKAYHFNRKKEVGTQNYNEQCGISTDNFTRLDGIWVSEGTLKKLGTPKEFTAESAVHSILSYHSLYWFSIYLLSKIKEQGYTWGKHNKELESLIDKHSGALQKESILPIYLFTRLLKRNIFKRGTIKPVEVVLNDSLATVTDNLKSITNLGNLNQLKSQLAKCNYIVDEDDLNSNIWIKEKDGSVFCMVNLVDDDTFLREFKRVLKSLAKEGKFNNPLHNKLFSSYVGDKNCRDGSKMLLYSMKI